MYIVLGTLAVATAVVLLLNRLAKTRIDLYGLNSFLWNRRRKWRELYEGSPIRKIENSTDATSILTVAVANTNGELISEPKDLLLNLFKTEFHQSKKNFAGLLISAGICGPMAASSGKTIKHSHCRAKTASFQNKRNLKFNLYRKLLGQQAEDMPTQKHWPHRLTNACP